MRPKKIIGAFSRSDQIFEAMSIYSGAWVR